MLTFDIILGTVAVIISISAIMVGKYYSFILYKIGECKLMTSLVLKNKYLRITDSVTLKAYAIIRNHHIGGWGTINPDMVYRMVSHALQERITKNEVILSDYEVLDDVAPLVAKGHHIHFPAVEGICMSGAAGELTREAWINSGAMTPELEEQFGKIYYFIDPIVEDLLMYDQPINYDHVCMFVSFLLGHERRHSVQPRELFAFNELAAVQVINGSQLHWHAYFQQPHEADAQKYALKEMRKTQKEILRRRMN